MERAPLFYGETLRGLLSLLMKLLLKKGNNAMMRLGKFGTAAVLSLVLSLALFTTGVFAQATSQQVEHNRQISISAHAATAQHALRNTASMLLSGSLQGQKGASNNCGQGGCHQAHDTAHCASDRECHTVQVCHWTHAGRVCRGERICRFRLLCRRCADHGVLHPWDAKHQ